MHKLRVTAVVGIVCGAAWAGAEEPAPAPAAVLPRPEMRALRVPDGAIKIDADATDWAVFGQTFTGGAKSAAFPATLSYANLDRGPWLGPDDFSLTVWVAADSANLYVLADVRDQLLFNDAYPKEIYLGDDFEIFIDANPPAAQFASARNENARQFIFLPAWVNPALPAGLIWNADTNPGLKMASRLRPWGYTIEVQIPKALFPNWQQHPELDAVGFDIMAGDADSPGMDGPHGAIKYAGFLLSPANHFQASDKLARLVFDATGAAPAVPGAGKDPILRTAENVLERHKAVQQRAAQQLLDGIGGPGAGAAAAAALNGADGQVRQSGLLILAKRPELPAPTAPLLELCAPVKDAPRPPAEIVNYALAALAERKQLPVQEWFDFYNHAPDPQVRLSWLWCCMVNGNKAVVPELQALLTDQNLRVRVKAAMALGELADADALPALEKMKTGDPHMYAQRAAGDAIQAIEKRAGPGK